MMFLRKAIGRKDVSVALQKRRPSETFWTQCNQRCTQADVSQHSAKSAKRTIMFTGQGSQTVGMGKELAETFKEARDVFHQVDETLKLNLSTLMFSGEQAELDKTEMAQPAIVAFQWAVLEVLRTQFNVQITDFDYAMGHSVGEMSAMVAACSIDPTAAIKLAARQSDVGPSSPPTHKRRRGKSMQDCAVGRQPSMAAVFPITEEDAKKAINAVDIQLRNTNLVVDLANINSPKQVVFSGDAEAVSLACEIAKKTWGAKKVVPLQVSAPFHSRIVRPASQAVARFLSKTPTVQPWIPIISNYTANIVTTPEELITNFIMATFSPVKWSESVKRSVSLGASEFVEIGPKKVLCSLVTQTAEHATTQFLSTSSELELFARNIDRRPDANPFAA